MEENKILDTKIYLDGYKNITNAINSLDVEDKTAQIEKLEDEIRNLEKYGKEYETTFSANDTNQAKQKRTEEIVTEIANREKEIEKLKQKNKEVQKNIEYKKMLEERKETVKVNARNEKEEKVTGIKNEIAELKNKEQEELLKLNNSEEMINLYKQLNDMEKEEKEHPNKARDSKYKEFLQRKINNLNENYKEFYNQCEEKIAILDGNIRQINKEYQKFLQNLIRIDNGLEIEQEETQKKQEEKTKKKTERDVKPEESKVKPEESKVKPETKTIQTEKENEKTKDSESQEHEKETKSEEKTIKLSPEELKEIKKRAEKENHTENGTKSVPETRTDNHKSEINYDPNFIERIQKENEAILHPDKEVKPNLVAITCLTKLGIYLKTYDNGKVETFEPTTNLDKTNVKSEIDLNIAEMLSGKENLENLTAYRMNKNEFKIIYDSTINYKDYKKMMKENDIDILDTSTQLKKQSFSQKRLLKKMAKNQDKSRDNVTTFTSTKKILNKIKNMKHMPKLIADRIPETKYDTSLEEVNTEMMKAVKSKINENNPLSNIERPKSEFLKEIDARKYARPEMINKAQNEGLTEKDTQNIINNVEKDMGIKISSEKTINKPENDERDEH